MKIYSFIATTAIAALALAGCNKEQVTAPAANPDEGTKAITLSIKGVNMTKTTMVPDVSWAKAASIDQIDIYFTSESKNILYAYRLSETSHTNAWNAINSTEGNNKVRFIGLDGVSQVYVVANDVIAEPYTEGNISQISADLINMYGTKDNTDVLYVGGDDSLDPIGTEVAGDVGANVGADGSDMGTQTPEDMAAQYYTANISIRPVISRLEINKISAVVDGSGKIIVNEGEESEKTYTVEYTGFQPQLAGIYMSDFSGILNPVDASLEDTFATPEGNLIANGTWASGAGIADRFNVPGITLFSNYTDNNYKNLFDSEPGKGVGSSEYVYFQGSNTCVPFNFLVPFDILPKEDGTFDNPATVPASSSFEAPKFHFQFVFPQDKIDDFTITKITDDATGSEVTEDDPLYDQLTAKLVFTVANTEGNIYYANVTGFLNNAGDSAVTVAPNTIYRMNEVQITPFNLTGGTVTSDEYNIIVKVDVLEYNEMVVKPSFE